MSVLELNEHRSILRRFATKYEVDANGCWLWTAYVDPEGYGRFRMHGQPTYAHRTSHELFIGPIPPGLQIDHLCRVRRCVNPRHLEAVTGSENCRRSPLHAAAAAANGRAVAARKTHCPKGHAYSEDNTYTHRGRRSCRTCVRESGRAYYRRKKAAA